MAVHAFGDSVTQYIAASDAAHGFVALLATALGVAITNHGTSGDMVADGSAKVYGVTPGSGDKFTIMFGINDERIYGVDATKQSYYRRGLQCLIAYLATGTKQLAVSNGSYTGSWSATGVFGLGKSSNTNGSTAQFTVSGSTVYVGMIQQDSAPGTYDIQIDGSTIGSFTTQTTGLATVNGVTYGARLHRFSGLSSGSHTVKIIVTSTTGGGNQVYVDWVAGSSQTIKPNVYVGNVIKAQAYSSGGSDANVASYNVDVAALVSELQSDGLNVRMVDVLSVLNYSVDMDGAYHPVNSGHAKLEVAFFAAFNGPPPRVFGMMV